MNWKKLFARFLYYGFKLITLLLILPVYSSLISEGYRLLIPGLGQRLSRSIFLAFLDTFELTYRLDLANILSVFLLVFAWLAWEILLQLVLGGEINTLGLDPEKFKKAVIILASTLIGTDACLFFMSATNSSWGSTFSFAAVLATAAYVAILVSISFVSCCLSRNVKMCS